ncbi:hypothetical protein SOVF_175520 [Spinacia oleracea]|nr:hypothetical protein SOVF_175520 [Spinacia oleracea]
MPEPEDIQSNGTADGDETQIIDIAPAKENITTANADWKSNLVDKAVRLVGLLGLFAVASLVSIYIFATYYKFQEVILGPLGIVFRFARK